MRRLLSALAAISTLAASTLASSTTASAGNRGWGPFDWQGGGWDHYALRVSAIWRVGPVVAPVWALTPYPCYPQGYYGYYPGYHPYARPPSHYPPTPGYYGNGPICGF